ncbi:acyltransferase [Candidatus Roizmanbacteria bacterium]|nr:acyltransferase [Candidatus Roizmanbacteria bacterium]
MNLPITDKTGKKLSGKETLQKIQFRLSTVILETTVYFLYNIGRIPFHHIRRFLYRMNGMKIGKGSSIHMGTRLYNPKNISVGDDSIIGEDAVLDGREKLTIGNHVDIASDVMIYNSEHNVNTEHFSAVENVVQEPVIIEDYVFIGPRAIILPGSSSVV